MKHSSDTKQTIQMKRLGAVAAGALLAGLLLHQVFALSQANAADAAREVKAAQTALEEARQAQAAATNQAAQLAGANAGTPGVPPPAAPIPLAPPRGGGGHSNDTSMKDLMALSIPIVAIVMGIGIGMLAIWTEHKKRTRLLELCHQERMAALEKGLELPPFPLEHPEPSEEPQAKSSGLKGGLIWLALGVGLGLFLGLQPKPDFHPALSAIPIALGLAYLAYYGIEGRKHSPSGK
jgi:hypothetical protein